MHNAGWVIRALLIKAFVALISVVLLIWTLLPLYHMLVLSLTPVGAAFAGRLWPETLTFENFGIVLTQRDHYLALFWQQLGNSLFVALAACLIVLVCSLMAAFAIARLRPRFGPSASRLALVAYFVSAWLDGRIEEERQSIELAVSAAIHGRIARAANRLQRG